MKKLSFYFIIIILFLINPAGVYPEESLPDKAVFHSSAENFNIKILSPLFETFAKDRKLTLSFNFFTNKENTRRHIYLNKPQIGILDYNYFQESGREYKLVPNLIAERDGKPFFTIVFIKRKGDKKISINSIDEKRISVYSKNFKRADVVYKKGFGETIKNVPYLMVNNNSFDSFIALTLKETDIVIDEKKSFEYFKTLYPLRAEGLEIIYVHQPLPNQLIFSFDDNKTAFTEKNIQTFLFMHKNRHGEKVLDLLGYDRWIPIDRVIFKQLAKIERLKYSYLRQDGNAMLALNGDVLPGMVRKKPIQEGKIISIVTSGELSIYNEAVSRFKELMKGADIKEYSIDEEMKITELGMINRLRTNDLIFTLGSIATVAVKKITKEKPIIFGMVLEPAKNNIPGNLVSGIKTRVPIVSSLAPVLSIKQVKKVGVIHSKENNEIIKAEGEILQADGIQLLPIIKMEKGKIKTLFKILLNKGMEVLWLYPDKWLTKKSFNSVLEISIKTGIPVIAPSNQFVKNRAFLSVYADPSGVGNQGAVMAKQILSGSNPAELGVQYPTSTKVACNMTTAKQLGMELKKELLRLCDEIYE